MDSRIREPMQLALRTVIPSYFSQISVELYLDVIDYLLHHARVPEYRIGDLERVLSDGGSAWRATPRGLEGRVDETLQGIAESVFATDSRPADYLRSAWHKAWGREPDPTGAYREAVRAVEAAFAPTVSPNNGRPTLGTIIADINNKPSKFSVRLQADTPNANVERIVGMLRMLWKSQLDRHGTADESVPLNVTLDEARDALALATTLVHLAQQGGFSANGN